MKVRVKQLGIYGAQRRRPGEILDVPDGFKASWVEPVPEEAPAPAPVVKSGRRGTLTLSEGGKQVGADLGNADLA